MKNLNSLLVCISILVVVGLACRPTDNQKVNSNPSRGEASPAERRQVAKRLQDAFVGYEDEVSIYTKGEHDEILCVGWAGLTGRDKDRADASVHQFRSKLRGYGFRSIDFGDGLQAFWTYPVSD